LFPFVLFVNHIDRWSLLTSVHSDLRVRAAGACFLNVFSGKKEFRNANKYRKCRIEQCRSSLDINYYIKSRSIVIRTSGIRNCYYISHRLIYHRNNNRSFSEYDIQDQVCIYVCILWQSSWSWCRIWIWIRRGASYIYWFSDEWRTIIFDLFFDQIVYQIISRVSCVFDGVHFIMFFGVRECGECFLGEFLGWFIG